MSDKMPSREESKMVRTISSVLADMGAGASPEDAVVKAATGAGLSQAQTARVCEACNKMSAIKRLSGTDSAAKAGTFPLADPAKVSARMRSARKAAKSPVVLRKTAGDDLPPLDPARGVRSSLGLSGLDKAAIVGVEMSRKLADEPQRLMHLTAMYDHQVVAKKAAEAAYERAFADMLVSLERATAKEASDLAAHLAHGSGPQQGLLGMLAEHLPDGMASSIKVAGAHAPTGSVLEGKAQAVVDAAGKAVDAREAADLAMKEALDLLATTVASLGLLNDKQTVPEIPSTTESPLRVTTLNRMNELAMKDSFANMYLDDEFLLQYEPREVLDAYNRVLQMVPGLHQRQNADAIITAMVKRLMTAGGQVDPLELKTIADVDKALAEAQKTKDARLWD